MAKAGRALVVEGYTDVLALHQAGLTETVGIMGTAITEQQIAQLSATVDTVILALDADAAGRKAMLRAQEVAAGRKLAIRVVAMPAGEDPAEIATAENGGERFRELVAGAVDLPDFQIGLILDSVDSTSPQDRDRGLGEAAPVLAAIAPGATREDLTRKVAERLGIDPTVVIARLGQAPAPESAPRPTGVPASVAGDGLSGGSAGTRAGVSAGVSAAGDAPPPRALLTRRERLERSMLVMCIARPAEGRTYLSQLDEEHLSSPLIARTVAWLSEHLEDPMNGLDPEDRELHRLVGAMVVRADPDQIGEGSIRRNFKELELAALEDRITTAAAEGDSELRARLSRERSTLVEEVRRAEG